MTARPHDPATCPACTAQRAELAKDTGGLRCASCGAQPDAGMPAVAGGTHMKRVEHGVGIPGRKTTVQLRTCGKWRAREPGEEG
jgi:hypothetical protein